MRHWIGQLDRLLRGEVTRLPLLLDGTLQIPLIGFVFLIAAMGVVYGLCMGIFSLTPGGSGQAMQVPASMMKVPALYLLTLLVTFPSLYVFNALVGSPLKIGPVLRLLIAALAVMLAALSSIGPIVAFFSVTTTSYPFMILLNVLVFCVAGLLGMAFLLQTLHRLNVAAVSIVPVESLAADALPDSPLSMRPEQTVAAKVKRVFGIWVVAFALVGAQMSWVLRPFIGRPGQPFTWFRHTDSNFFQAVLNALHSFFF